jgi:hypothetical protein
VGVESSPEFQPYPPNDPVVSGIGHEHVPEEIGAHGLRMAEAGALGRGPERSLEPDREADAVPLVVGTDGGERTEGENESEEGRTERGARHDQ